MIKKCPLCNSEYTKSGFCTSTICELCYTPIKSKKDWSHIWYRFRHLTFDEIRYFIKSRFFDRYDLIRTNLPKHHYIDKVELMLYGVMNLIVDYVEKEEAFDIIDGSQPYGDNNIPFKDQVLKLYTDWKVRYPKLLKEYDDLLSYWGEGQAIKFNNHTNHVEFEYFRPKNEQDLLSDELHTKEQRIYDFEQNMLHDAINIRRGLWS